MEKEKTFPFGPKSIFYDIMEVSAILFVRFVKVILANSYKRSSMNKQDISTIIDLHFEEMTDLEQEIARYFLQADTINDDLSSQQVTQKLHISQAALTRLPRSVVLRAIENSSSNINNKKTLFLLLNRI